MDTTIPLVLAFAAGGLVGAIFFTGLWFTVRRLPGAANPMLLMIGSAALRLGLVVPAFAFIAGGSWGRLGMAILGFLVLRTVLILRWRPTGEI